MDLLFKLNWIKILLFTSFFSISESSVDLPTVTVRGFLNFKTTVDGTVIVFTPVSEVHPPSVATTTSSASLPAEPQKDDFTKEKRMQNLSFAQQNFLSSHKTHASSMDSKIKESHISENAVLPSSNPGDRLKKMETTISKEMSEDFHGLSHKVTKNASSRSTQSEKLASNLPKVSSPTQSASIQVIAPSITVEPQPLSSLIDAPKSTEEIVSESFEPFSSALHISKQIITSSDVNYEFLKISSSIADESDEDKILFESVRVNSNLQQISSTLNSKSMAEQVSSSKTVGYLTSSKTRLADETAVTSTELISEISASVGITNTSQLPSLRSELESSNSIEDTKSHLLQSSFNPLTASRAEHPTESLETASLKENRTRFYSLRRPSQSVKLNRFKVKLTLRPDSVEENDEVTDSTDEVTDSKDEVTDSIDPAKVVFKETTITSEVILHVGRRKSIRLLTITTSVPMTVHPTDISLILSAEEDEEESNFNVETRTFTTTERVLKTSIVPVYDGKSTAYHKVTESFFIMKFITAYKTLPTGDITLLDDVVMATSSAVSESSAAIQLQNPFLSFGQALSNNPLAAVYLGLQQLNAQMTLFSTVTNVSTYLTTETFYTTKTVRFYDGKSNNYRTVSEPTSTKIQTVTTTLTSLQPYISKQQKQAQLEPQFETKTSTYVSKTISTSLSTRVYTLIYNGFSTKFRTVTSTTTYPVVITVTSTTKIPLNPTHFMY